MRFKFLMIFILSFSVLSCGGWFGEAPPQAPELKVHYTENDESTKLCFEKIKTTYDAFFEGNLIEPDFVKAMYCTEALLFLGASRVMGKDAESYTRQEIDLIFTSGLLREKRVIEDWVKRIYGLINLLRGTEEVSLSKQRLKEFFSRVRTSSNDFVHMSRKIKEMKRVSLQSYDVKEREKYWHLRKEIFLDLMNVARRLWQDTKAPLVKSVMLHQYDYLAPSFGKAQWEKWVGAIFLMNATLFNRTPDVIHADNIQDIIKHVESTFQTIFEVYALNEYPVWEARHIVDVITLYEKLFYGFLEEFYQSTGQMIRAGDLVALLEKLHVASQADASLFVSAILELKTQIFKSDAKDFTREDIKKIRDILKQSMDAKAQVNVLSHEIVEAQVRQQLGSFKKDAQDPDAQKLSLIFLSYIDAFLKLYDTDGDMKISLYKAGHIFTDELSALMKTAQKLKAGFQNLMGEGHVMGEVEDSVLEVLIKSVFAVGDRLFQFSNQDEKLDRKEILSILYFMVENGRMTSRAQQYLYGHSMDILWDRTFFIDEFPQLSKSFSNREELHVYMQRISNLVQLKSLPDTIAVPVILGYVRLIEHVFLKYDTNQDHILNQGEIEKFLDDFKPYFKEAFEHFQKESWKNNANKKQSWSEWFTQVWLGPEEFQKRILFYMLTTGKVPTSWPSAISDLSKKHATREDFVQLIENFLKEN